MFDREKYSKMLVNDDRWAFLSVFHQLFILFISERVIEAHDKNSNINTKAKPWDLGKFGAMKQLSKPWAFGTSNTLTTVHLSRCLIVHYNYLQTMNLGIHFRHLNSVKPIGTWFSEATSRIHKLVGNTSHVCGSERSFCDSNESHRPQKRKVLTV